MTDEERNRLREDLEQITPDMRELVFIAFYDEHEMPADMQGGGIIDDLINKCEEENRTGQLKGVIRHTQALARILG